MEPNELQALPAVATKDSVTREAEPLRQCVPRQSLGTSVFWVAIGEKSPFLLYFQKLDHHPMSGNPALFTVGHSNHTEEHFVNLLLSNGIDVLADVRSQPFSKYTPHFNRDNLQEALRAKKIRYLFMGDQLGGRPPGDDFYDIEGHVLYHRVADADFFLKGLERIEQGIQTFRVAMMCSEEDPLVCHRHRLVARVLRTRGVPIQHIRQDGKLDSYEEVEPAFQQKLLFAELEKDEWKSLQSVLPKSTLENSSDD